MKLKNLKKFLGKQSRKRSAIIKQVQFKKKQQIYEIMFMLYGNIN